MTERVTVDSATFFALLGMADDADVHQVRGLAGGFAAEERDRAWRAFAAQAPRHAARVRAELGPLLDVLDDLPEHAQRRILLAASRLDLLDLGQCAP